MSCRDGNARALLVRWLSRCLQTVENYFYFSFGVKDSLFGLGVDDDGMYTCAWAHHGVACLCV